MSDFEIIGGIKFFTKDIKEINIKEKSFEITLMDDTVIEYPMQSDTRIAEVVVKDAGRIEFNGITNATIKDSPGNDIYVLSGCEHVTVYADGGTMEMDNEEIGADQDLIELSNRIMPDSSIQYSKGNILKLNKNDLYKLPDDETIHCVKSISQEIKE